MLEMPLLVTEFTTIVRNEILHAQCITQNAMIPFYILTGRFFSMALPDHSGPWPLIQFRNHFFADGRTPWTSDQPVASSLPKHRTTQTQNKHIHTPTIAASK
jgi:hypothetical protein